jgi:hypothetical protein
MAIPGFTAATVVHKSSEHYTRAGAVEAPADGAAVVPQACTNIGPCRVCVNVRTTFGIPTGACLQFSCLGFSRSFCVP